MSALHTLRLTVSDVSSYEPPSGFSRIELDYEYDYTCPGCEGWQECREDHSGFDIEDESSPAFDVLEGDEIEIHGVNHTYRWSWGWTTVYPGCVLRDADTGDEVFEIARVFGPGDYLVEDDWDDGTPYVTPVSMADGSPLPEAGWAERALKEKGREE